MAAAGLSLLASAALFTGLELEMTSAAEPLVIVCDKNVADKDLRNVIGNDGITTLEQACFAQTFTGAPVVVRFVD